MEALDLVRERHIAAFNDGDVNAWVGAFTADGVQSPPPNAPASLGRESIRAWSQALIAAFLVNFALAVDEVQVPGDWAFERGTYTINLTPKTAVSLSSTWGTTSPSTNGIPVVPGGWPAIAGTATILHSSRGGREHCEVIGAGSEIY